ncbi:Rootletin [Dissostichus eleginoides]|uniref:Rootletin n=1 Tax=Dissostichus eleginoides TaxID=100907 RepID=A0AAD9CID5_DISEL|nr:Rootletin [Dissostichus eleginoides]
MQSELLIGWQQERAGLTQEVSRLHEDLAESRAEREELESRNRALNERLSQANKVLEYRGRCKHLDDELQDEHTQLIHTQLRIRDEHNDSLESALIRLEEEQQRSVGLAETNALLREQLGQSEQANEALREDLQKLTTDWSRAVEEAGQREDDWLREREQQDRLLSVWRSMVALRRQCNTVKTATDRDLWKLRAEFSRVSSSLLSGYVSSLMSVLSLTESAMQRTNQELQLSLLRLGEEKSSVQLRLKQLEDNNQLLLTHTQHTQLELTHTLDTLSRYTHFH